MIGLLTTNEATMTIISMKKFKILFSLALFFSSSAFAVRITPDLVEKKNIINSLFSAIDAPVQSKNCDLKPRIGKKLLVADMLLDFILLNSRPSEDGILKTSRLECRQNECELTSSEKISLPGQPEGWGRSLVFKFDPVKKKIDMNSLKCVDVP